MKVISFNVNGIRSVLGKKKDGSKIEKGESHTNVLYDLLKEQSPDVLCLQEVRCNSDVNISSLDLQSIGYSYVSMNCSQTKKGYSGTAIISKTPPLEVKLGFEDRPQRDEMNDEGRLITVVFDKYIIVNAYVPNSKADLSRLAFRINTWEASIRAHIARLQQTGNKLVVYCGDLNVAAQPIDVHNPVSAKGSHGFTEEERQAFASLLRECDLVDTFREKYPHLEQYSWFSAIAQSRKRGRGWRIDYVLISSKWKSKIVQAKILGEYFGSDHVPCMLEVTV